MKNTLISLAVKLLDIDTVCSLIAKAIAKLLEYASKRGGNAWDISKTVITKVNLWTSLFL